MSTKVSKSKLKKYDGLLTDLFDFQDEITVQILNADMFSARTLFEKAHNLDSGFLLPYVYLGWIHMFDAWLGLSESPERSIKKALDLGEEAYCLFGNKVEALKVAQEVNRVYPDFSAAYHVNAMGYRYEEDSKRFLDALEKAGLK